MMPLYYSFLEFSLLNHSWFHFIFYFFKVDLWIWLNDQGLIYNIIFDDNILNKINVLIKINKNLFSSLNKWIDLLIYNFIF